MAEQAVKLRIMEIALQNYLTRSDPTVTLRLSPQTVPDHQVRRTASRRSRPPPWLQIATTMRAFSFRGPFLTVPQKDVGLR